MAIKRKFIDTETTIVAKNETEAEKQFRAIWPNADESPISKIAMIDAEKDGSGKATGNIIYRVHSTMEEGTTPAGV